MQLLPRTCPFLIYTYGMRLLSVKVVRYTLAAVLAIVAMGRGELHAASRLYTSPVSTESDPWNGQCFYVARGKKKTAKEFHVLANN